MQVLTLQGGSLETLRNQLPGRRFSSLQPPILHQQHLQASAACVSIVNEDLQCCWERFTAVKALASPDSTTASNHGVSSAAAYCSTLVALHMSQMLSMATEHVTVMCCWQPVPLDLARQLHDDIVAEQFYGISTRSLPPLLLRRRRPNASRWRSSVRSALRLFCLHCTRRMAKAATVPHCTCCLWQEPSTTWTATRPWQLR